VIVAGWRGCGARIGAACPGGAVAAVTGWRGCGARIGAACPGGGVAAVTGWRGCGWLGSTGGAVSTSG
jgi:hypothetical protein